MNPKDSAVSAVSAFLVCDKQKKPGGSPRAFQSQFAVVSQRMSVMRVERPIAQGPKSSYNNRGTADHRRTSR